MEATIKNITGELCDIEQIVFSGSAQELCSLLAEFGFVPYESRTHGTEPCSEEESFDGDEKSAFEEDESSSRIPRNYMELEGAEVLGVKTKFAYLRVSSKEHNDTFVIAVGWMDSLKSVNPNEVMSLLWRSLQQETGNTSTIEEAHVESKNTLFARSSYEGRHFFALRDDIVDWIRDQMQEVGIKATVTVKDI